MNNNNKLTKLHPLTGTKKKPIKQPCPFCGYKSDHPPGLARHIQTNHPDKWKGNLGSSLGKKPSRPWKKDKPHRVRTTAIALPDRKQTLSDAMRKSWARRKGVLLKNIEAAKLHAATPQGKAVLESLKEREERLRKRRIYQARLRKRYRKEGKNSKGELMPPGWKPRSHRRAILTEPQLILEPEQQTISADVEGDAARAILLAASVLRGVTAALRVDQLK